MERPMHLDPRRAYRQTPRPRPGETAFQVVVEQTDLWIVAGRDLSAEIAAFVHGLRCGLKNHILLDPSFAASLTPVDAPDEAPELVRRMARAARTCGVGPMAAVAGAIAQAVADRFVSESPDILVENGGDIFLHSTVERIVGLLARPVEGVRLGLRIPADRFPLAVCTSSGRVGHSLSLGRADLVAVLARDGALSDAAATALANLLSSEKDLEPMLDHARRLARQGITGVFAQVGEAVGAWGDLELVVLEEGGGPDPGP
ncbi:UPF0280 family protein [Desulfolutivibrio sulfoxidireducens]|nr:UPF0280 family protein [Desulfolutivibrio sulfoxidireducens]